MDRNSTLHQRHDSDYRDSQRPQQELHNSHVAVGVITHLLKLAGALSPLPILEYVKEPTKATRWIRISSIFTLDLGEPLGPREYEDREKSNCTAEAFLRRLTLKAGAVERLAVAFIDGCLRPLISLLQVFHVRKAITI